MISFDDANNYNIINNEVLNLTKGFCKCGTQLFIDNAYRHIICPNPDCKEKFLKMEYKLCNYIGFSIDTDELERLNEKYSIVSPYQLLQLDDLYNNNQLTESDVHNIEYCVQKLKEFKNKEIYIYEIFEMSGIDDISNIAYELFFGFNSMNEVYEEIDKSQIIFINERLGLNNKSLSLSVMIYRKLEQIRESIYFAEALLKIKTYNNRIKIAFNDDVTNYLNRTELMELFNSRYNKTFVMVTVINNETDIIVRNSWIKTYKIRKANEINDANIAKMLNNNQIDMIEIDKMTSDQFKPIGKQIYIDSLNNIINRLDIFYQNNNTE